jgi:hypothetical protein
MERELALIFFVLVIGFIADILIVLKKFKYI